MKIILVALLGSCLIIKCLGQDPHRVDSLSKVLASPNDDTVRALAIMDLTDEFVYTQPDSCLYYTEVGLQLLSNSVVKNKLERSFNPTVRAFEMHMYNRRAVAFSETRNDLLAIRMAIKAKQLTEDRKDTSTIGFVYGAMAEVYQNVGEPSVAKDYLFVLLSITKDPIYHQVWLANIGSCYYDLKEYDSALYYLSKIPVLFLNGNRPWPFPTLYLGNTYVKKGEYEKAVPFYRTSIAYAQYDHYGYDLCRAYIGIASAFNGLELTDSARLYATRCIHIANDLSLPAQSLEANTFLANLYESRGIIDSAFKYQKISDALKDSLFNRDKIKEVQNYTFSEKLREREIEEEQAAYKSKIRTYVLVAALIVFLFVAGILFRNNRHKQKLNSILKQQKEKVENTLTELRIAQSQLIQQEKMASLGELTAGIAHEIQNPLNFVNNFSQINKELLVEMAEEIEKGNFGEVSGIAKNAIENEEKINFHGERANAIVKNMLMHSRVSSGKKELTDLNTLCNDYLKLAYHGLRAKDKSFNAKLETDFDATIGQINVVPQDIGRVLLNLINNALYAVAEKKQQVGGSYEPCVSMRTTKLPGKIEIAVMDNGNGISEKLKGKIFQPFFTTKPTGQGTGLGLSLAYDIVKAHGGEIRLEAEEGKGSDFIVHLPIT